MPAGEQPGLRQIVQNRLLKDVFDNAACKFLFFLAEMIRLTSLMIVLRASLLFLSFTDTQCQCARLSTDSLLICSE